MTVGNSDISGFRSRCRKGDYGLRLWFTGTVGPAAATFQRSATAWRAEDWEREGAVELGQRLPYVIEMVQMQCITVVRDVVQRSRNPRCKLMGNLGFVPFLF
jgi:hypothetical protein